MEKQPRSSGRIRKPTHKVIEDDDDYDFSSPSTAIANNHSSRVSRGGTQGNTLSASSIAKTRLPRKAATKQEMNHRPSYDSTHSDDGAVSIGQQRKAKATASHPNGKGHIQTKNLGMTRSNTSKRIESDVDVSEDGSFMKSSSETSDDDGDTIAFDLSNQQNKKFVPKRLHKTISDDEEEDEDIENDDIETGISLDDSSTRNYNGDRKRSKHDIQINKEKPGNYQERQFTTTTLTPTRQVPSKPGPQSDKFKRNRNIQSVISDDSEDFVNEEQLVDIEETDDEANTSIQALKSLKSNSKPFETEEGGITEGSESEYAENQPSYEKKLTNRQRSIMKGGFGSFKDFDDGSRGKSVTEEDILKKKELADRRRQQKIIEDEAIKENTIQKLLRRAEKQKKEIEKPKKPTELPCGGYRYIDSSGNSLKDTEKKATVYIVRGDKTNDDDLFWEPRKLACYPPKRPECVICKKESLYSHKELGQRICSLHCYKILSAK